MTEIQVEKDKAAATDPDADFEAHNSRLDSYLQACDFEGMSPEEMLSWAASTFEAGRTLLSTSFQASGVTMIHIVSQLGLDVRVATIDTLRLHPETYGFIRDVEERYGIDIEVQRPDANQVRSMVERFGEYLFFDNKAKQEYCCQIRKTRPHDELLKSVDCWISGLRRDQSAFREDTPKAVLVPEYGTRRHILKLNPLADWSEERLVDYMTRHDVPQHPLYAQGYDSIGCLICSTPTLAGEPKRAGRWRWFNADERPSEEDIKECGLHIPMYNI